MYYDVGVMCDDNVDSLALVPGRLVSGVVLVVGMSVLVRHLEDRNGLYTVTPAGGARTPPFVAGMAVGDAIFHIHRGFYKNRRYGVFAPADRLGVDQVQFELFDDFDAP